VGTPEDGRSNDHEELLKRAGFTDAVLRRAASNGIMKRSHREIFSIFRKERI
jgi:hypothetical protein